MNDVRCKKAVILLKVSAVRYVGAFEAKDWTPVVSELAANVVDATPVWCGHDALSGE